MRTTSSSVRCSSSCSSSTSEFDRNHNHQKMNMKTRKNVMRFSQARSQRNRSIGSEHAMIDRDELEIGQSAQKNPSQWLQRARESKESERVGVLLLNLGGPETLDDVEPFLYNLFRDPDIIRLPRQFKFLQTIVASVISKSRAPKSRKAYASIGGGSPLRRITNEQKNALKAAIRRKGFESCECYVGMRYWKPFTEDAIEEIKRDRITRLVVLPLYPQFSISTSGSSLRLLEEIFREDDVLKRLNMQHTVIPSWYSRPGYVRSMAKMIKKTLESEAFVDAPEKPVVFFSAHGVPTSYVLEGGDPYKDEMEECVKLITDELKMIGCEGYKHVLAYQSRVGPVEWLKPYTDDTIRALGDQGTKALCAVPVSFVSEHIETLEEMDQEYRELAEESGIEYWGRVPALDCDEIFIDDLADAVVEALPSSTTTTSQSQSSKNTTTSTTKEIVPSKTSVDEILSAYDSKDLTIPTREFTYETDDVLPFIAVSAFCLFLGIQVRLGIEGIFAPGAGIVPDGLGGSDFFPFQ